MNNKMNNNNSGIIHNYDGLKYNEEAGTLTPTYKADKKEKARKEEEEKKHYNEGVYYGSRKQASNTYIQSLGEAGSDEIIQNVIIREDFINLMKWIKKQASAKKYSDYCITIEGLLKGYTSDEIASTNNVSIGRIKHAREDLKDYYKKYSKKIDVRRYTNDINYITTYNEDNTCSGKKCNVVIKGGLSKWEGLKHIKEASMLTSIKKQEEEARKQLHNVWKTSKVVIRREEGEEAGRRYILKHDWEDAIQENIRRQNAWEDYTRYIAFNTMEKAVKKEYKEENGYYNVYEDGIKVRSYKMHKKQEASKK